MAPQEPETQAQAIQRISNAKEAIRRGRAIRPRLNFEAGQEPNIRFFRIRKPEEVVAPPIRPTRPAIAPPVAEVGPAEAPPAREVRPTIDPAQTRVES